MQFSTSILIFIFFMSIFGWKPAVGSATHSRGKRYLDFMKATRMFFRVNIKENVVNWATIWAHGVGFKANMPIMSDKRPLRPYRRDTYEVLNQLLDMHGFDGQACILKAFCATERSADGNMLNGFLYKFLRHAFKLNDNDRKHFSYLKDENCDQILHHHCPLSFNSISPYTDDI